MRTQSYKRDPRTGQFLDGELPRTALEIIRDFVGHERNIHSYHWPVDKLSAWFFRPPAESQYQDYFAEAGKAALVIDLDKIDQELSHV